jgi:hypothetical protein
MEHFLLLSLRGQVLALIPVSPTLSAADRHTTAEIFGADAAVVIPRRTSAEPTLADAAHDDTGEDVDVWCDARGIEPELRESIRARAEAEPWKLLRDVAREARERQTTLRRIGAKRRVTR